MSRSRGEVEGPAGVVGEPCPHLRVLVGGVVVDDRMDQLAGPAPRPQWR